MASTEGLHRILDLELILFPSPAGRVFSSSAAIEPTGSICGLRVSKHMMPSKQSSKPNLWST